MSKVEAGAQFSLRAMTRFSGTTDGGFGGRFTWNLFPSLALETEFAFSPTLHQPPSTQEGGRTTSWFTSVKSAAVRQPKYAVFGKAGAGVVSFGDVAVQTSATSLEFRRVTNFATNLGGVFEYSLSPRWILRMDLGLELIQIHSRTVPVGTSGFIIAPGSLHPAFQWSAGVGYRLGELRPTREEESVKVPGKWEAAGEFVTQSRMRATIDMDVVTEPGIGGRVDYDLLRHLSLEAAVTWFPRSASATVLDGGRSVQTLFGVKTGIRHERM